MAYWRARAGAAEAERDAAKEEAEDWRLGTDSLAEQLDALADALAAAERARDEALQDAERWRWAKAGLFITPHPDNEIQVVYQGALMDEVAAALYAELPKNSRGIVHDVTPVFDERIRRALAGAPREPSHE